MWYETYQEIRGVKHHFLDYFLRLFITRIVRCQDQTFASAGCLLKRSQKGFPVFVIQVNGISAVALALHVIDCSGVFYSQGAAHAGSVPEKV